MRALCPFYSYQYAERIISLLDNSPKKDELLKLLVTHSTLEAHTRQLQEEENGGSKQDFLRDATKIEGVYVPSLYEFY